MKSSICSTDQRSGCAAASSSISIFIIIIPTAMFAFNWQHQRSKAHILDSIKDRRKLGGEDFVSED